MKLMKRRMKKKKIDLTGYYPKPGDFIVSWGRGFFSWLVMFLVYLKDGTKNSPSHNMHVHNSKWIASAEMSGYKKVSLWKRLDECKRVMIFRFDEMKEVKMFELSNLTRVYFNKLYDFALYFIKLFQVMIIFVPVYLYYSSKLGLKETVLLIIGLIVLYFPVMAVLRKLEKFTVACSEAEGELYKKIGLLKGVKDATNLSPQTWLWILLNNSKVKLIFDSDWN